MGRQTVTLALVCVGVATTTWLCRPVRFILTQSLASSVYWTARSWLWNYPVTPDFDMWDEGDPAEYEKFKRQRRRIIRTWNFLQPFFASHGYTMYIKKKAEVTHGSLIPPSEGNQPRGQVQCQFPYAQYACKSDAELTFIFVSPSVWPARDNVGREVVIKAVSGAVPTKELRALQLLHSNPLCNDPRNRTIPVIEMIEFNQQVFAVMPRWSMPIEGDFVTVGELIRYGKAFFEATAFLHENKIAHGDMLTQNMMMDILVPQDSEYRFAGYYGPERRYALIDFETAVLPNMDGSFSPEFEYRAKRDIFLLGHSVGVKLRCIEHLIPELDNLFDSMHQSDSPVQPTAAIALARFEDMCRHLTSEELDLPVQGVWWRDGVIEYRDGPPIFREF